MSFPPDIDADTPAVACRNDASPQLLVTGASGFLGSEIVRQCVEQKIAVRTLVRNAQPGAGQCVQQCVGDITDPASLSTAMTGMTTIVHSAGLAHQFGKSAASVQAFEQINVQGTANVMRAAVAAGVSHVVLVSSVSVYGGGAEPTDETFPCHPKDAYGVSKWQAEQVARQIADASGMRLTILRMATIFGEQDPGNIGRLMHAIARGRFVWLGQGTNRKSLVYRGDAARACLLAAMSSSRSESGDERIRVYNVSASAVSVAQIVRGLATGLGRGTPHWYIPAPLVTTIGRGLSVCMAHRGPVARMNRTIAKWLSDDVYLADRFERDFQFRPRVSLDEGLGREAAWYRHSKAA